MNRSRMPVQRHPSFFALFSLLVAAGGLGGLAGLLALPGQAVAGQAPGPGGVGLPGLEIQVQLPESWEGIWENDMEMRDCENGSLIFQDVQTDTLCGGEEPFQPGEGSGVTDYECTGTTTDTEIQVVCTSQQEVSEGCVASTTATIDITRNGASMSGTQVVEIDVPLGCFYPFPDCMEITVTGTRISPEAPGCTLTPTAGSTWGALKQTYR